MDRSDGVRPLAPPDGYEAGAYRLPDGRPIALFGALAHSPAAAADLRGATARALGATVLTVRMREVLVLRVQHRMGATAEWQVHVALFAAEAALSPTDLDAVRDGTSDVEDDALMIELADAICDGGAVGEPTWYRLYDRLGATGTVDALFVAAQYLKVAVMERALRIAPPFPGNAAALTTE